MLKIDSDDLDLAINMKKSNGIDVYQVDTVTNVQKVNAIELNIQVPFVSKALDVCLNDFFDLQQKQERGFIAPKVGVRYDDGRKLVYGFERIQVYVEPPKGHGFCWVEAQHY